MKFKVHLFREVRHTFEVDADSADEALNYVDENIYNLTPVSEEELDYLPQSCIDPILPDGSVDYDNSTWSE